MKRNVLVGITISGMLVFLIIHHIDFKQLAISLRSVSYLHLIMAVFILLSTLLIKSLRWRYVIQPIKAISTLNLLSFTSIGAMADMVLPARTGDFVRAYAIGKKEEVSKLASLATVAIERVFDVFTVLTILLLSLLLFNIPTKSTTLIEHLRIGGLSFALLFLLLAIALLLLKSRPAHVISLIRSLFAFLPDGWLRKLTKGLESFASGLQAIKKDRHLLSIFLLSLCLWTLYGFSNFLILRCFSLDLPYYAAFYFIIFQALGVAIPSSPGFIGTYHAAVLAGFTVFDVPRELALSVAIIMHASFFIPFTFLGFVFLWIENLSFKELWSVRKA